MGIKVCFICGYYSDLAHKLARRPEDYWDAYFYVWAVKMGSYKRSFFVQTTQGKVRVTANNIGYARKTFGAFVAERIRSETPGLIPLLVPIPSKDAVLGAATSRSLSMVREAMSYDDNFRDSVEAALHWTRPLPSTTVAFSAGF